MQFSVVLSGPDNLELLGIMLHNRNYNHIKSIKHKLGTERLIKKEATEPDIVTACIPDFKPRTSF